MSRPSIQRVIASLSGNIPIEKGMLPQGQRFILPFWHAVSEAQLPHLSHLYRVQRTSAFEKTLDFLLKHYRAATSDDVVKLAASRGKQEKPLFFPSFDDGLSECYQLIGPLLKRKGIQAAFFINPLFVDNKTLFHRHKASLILNVLDEQPSKTTRLKEAKALLRGYSSDDFKASDESSLRRFLHHTVYTDHWLLDQLALLFDIDFDHFRNNSQPYMTLGQIKELQQEGFLIGAHGMDHREFYLSSEEEIMDQISSSMDYLIEQVNPPLRTFAFPYTDFKVSDAIFERAHQANLWDLSFGTAGLKDETMERHLQRLPMESSGGSGGKQVIRSAYMEYYLKSVIGKNKVRRQ